MIGVAPGVKILPVRVTNPAAEYTAADIAAGIRWAFQHGARVLSNSWTWGDFPELHEAIREASAAGAVVVFAAGNDQGSSVRYPARYPECLAVGSSNQCDGPKRIDDESLDLYGHCSGPELSVVAPGTSMVTTDLMGPQGYSGDNYTASFNGTSSACPVVAGVAALLLSRAPGLKPGQVRELLQRTADDLTPVQLVGQPVDNLIGYGRVNADAALAALEVTLQEGPPASPQSAGGCFIATAAWGSYLDPHVVTLRRFRDRHLATNAPGRALVSLYYRLSPPLAAVIARHPSLRLAARLGLTPVLLAVEHPGGAGVLVLGFLSAAMAWRRRKAARALVALAFLFLLQVPAVAETRTFDGVVTATPYGNRVQPVVVRALDGRERTFWQSAQTLYGGLRPYPGMPVRVRYTPDPDPAFGSAREIRLRAEPGSLLATLDSYLLFHPGPGAIPPGSTVAALEKRYPFLSEGFIRRRFFEKGRLFRLYYETFPTKLGVLKSQQVSGATASVVWEGRVIGSETGDIQTTIRYRLVRAKGRWQVDEERFE